MLLWAENNVFKFPQSTERGGHGRTISTELALKIGICVSFRGPLVNCTTLGFVLVNPIELPHGGLRQGGKA